MSVYRLLALSAVIALSACSTTPPPDETALPTSTTAPATQTLPTRPVVTAPPLVTVPQQTPEVNVVIDPGVDTGVMALGPREDLTATEIPFDQPADTAIYSTIPQAGTQAEVLETTVVETVQNLPRLDDPGSILATRTFYFEFDSSNVSDELMAALAAHGEYLSNNPDVSLRLEGHADERGTREYNIALSERRALAVQQILQLYGSRPMQTEVVAYGEEVPANFEHSEMAWAENRRVELVYIGY